MLIKGKTCTTLILLGDKDNKKPKEEKKAEDPKPQEPKPQDVAAQPPKKIDYFKDAPKR